MTKNAKRVLLATLIAILLVTVSLLAVACETTTFTVTVTNDSTKGVVTLDPQKDVYESGEEVTATVAPNLGYAIDTVKVNGEAVTLSNGTFTFTVDSNTTIEVTYSEQQPSIHHIVTLNVGNHGSAILQPATADGIYTHGDQVTVIATPDSGYAATVKVNGNVILADSEGNFVFTVQANTTVDVSFGPLTMSKDVFASLVGNVRFDGETYYEERDPEDPEYNYSSQSHMITVFDADKELIWQYEESDYGIVYYNMLFGSMDGDYTWISHTFDNKLVQQQAQGEDFYKYFNQFEQLYASDFSYVSDGVWQLDDADLANLVSWSISGYNEPIESLLLYEEGGRIVRIVITTTEFERYGLYCRSIYEFDVSEDSIPQDWANVYEVTEANAELQTALEKAASATSYKVHRVDHMDGDEDIVYDQYVDMANSRTYNQYDGDGTDLAGYLIYDDALWDYYYIDGAAVLSTRYDPELIAFADFMPMFDGFDAALFESVGEGVYRLRAMDRMDGGIASSVGAYLGIGIDDIRFYSYAYDVIITVKDGELYTVELPYYMSMIGFFGKITLTFGEFNTAVIPVDLDISGTPLNLPDELFGNWYTQDGSITLAVNDQGVTINGDRCSVALSSYGYLVTWNGTMYEVYTESSDVICFVDYKTSAETYFIRENAKSLTYDFDQGIVGEWVEDGGTRTLEIKSDGTFTLDGEDAFIFAISAVSETIDFLVNGEHHYIQLQGRYIALDVYGLEGTYFIMTNGISNYYGTFEGTDNKGHSFRVEISSTSFTVTIDGVTHQVEDMEYDESYDEIIFFIDGTEYCISSSDYFNTPYRQLAIYYNGYSVYGFLNRVE